MKIAFLDRDGVINEEVGYLHKIEDFKFIDGVFDACKYLQKQGFKIIIITNQSGIGRGYYNTNDFNILTNWMLGEFAKNKIDILDVFHCPHAPNDGCNCRKPKTGMFENAAKKYKIDKENSIMVGDKEADITAANSFGLGLAILVASGHKIDKENSKASFIFDSLKNILTQSF